MNTQTSVAQMGDKKKTVIHWFRKGLRLHDNPAFNAAVKMVRENNDFVLRPIYVLDPETASYVLMGPNRTRFLHETLVQLDESLKSIGSKLYVIRGTPKKEFPKLISNWNVTVITYEIEIEPFNKRRDFLVKVIADQHNVKIEEFYSHTIFNPYVVLRENQNQVPMRMQSFLNVVAKIAVPEPVEMERFERTDNLPEPDAIERETASFYDVPTLVELNIDAASLLASKYPGGEAEGLKRLDASLSNAKWVCSFEKPNTSPNSIAPSTTVLSPYLTFGCVSSRLFYKRLNEVLAKRKHSMPPVSLMGQLMWREFYYTAAVSEDNFDRMAGNSICRQIPWGNDDRLLDAWAHGQTGYPFIDAIMRQLRTEGWIHHLARHAVACFLTRGDMWQSWEKGQRVFEELLLDADWALNAGNWMWLSASAFFYMYMRVYSPVAFGKKTDKRGDYIRKYCPELKHFPSDLIYEPWKASSGAQKQYKCIIGKDYPVRMVIHEEVLNSNKEKMSRAYRLHNRTENPNDRVLMPEPKVRVKQEMLSPRAIKQEPHAESDEDPENIC